MKKIFLVLLFTAIGAYSWAQNPDEGNPVPIPALVNSTNSSAQIKDRKQPQAPLQRKLIQSPNLAESNIVFVGKFVGSHYLMPQASSGAQQKDPVTVVLQVLRPITSPLPLEESVVIALPDSEENFTFEKAEYLVLAKPAYDAHMPYLKYLKVDKPRQQIIPLSSLNQSSIL